MAKEGQSITLNSAEHDSFMRFLANTRHPERDILIYLLTYRAGMRIGSVSQLKLAEILEEPISAKPTSAKVKQVCVLPKSITKGGKTTMAYISHPELQEAIKKYIATLKPTRRHPELLFVTQKGFPLTPNVASQIMLKHYNNAGFKGSSSHQGRAAFCGNLIKSGADIVAVSKLMGHSSLNTTMKYVRHNQQELSEMVAST